MSPHFAGWDERTLDLAIQEVTTGLTAQERHELLKRTRRNDLEQFERSVAAIHLAAMGPLEQPPSSLVKKLERQAEL